MSRALLLAVLVSGGLHADFPPAVESLRPTIQVAERRLQDVSLELQAAKHAAEPVQGQVAEARSNAGTWWGTWILKRRLGQLKTSLDRVERARAGQAAARQELALLLTGADEELSTALEASLTANSKRSDKALLAKWHAWWDQKRAWQQRLDALEPASDPDESETSTSGEAQGIRHEARQAQWERERSLVEVLEKRRALSGREAAAERSRLQQRYHSDDAP